MNYQIKRNQAKFRNLLIVLTLLCFSNCFNSKNESLDSQKGGVYVEHLDALDTDPIQQTRDNQIYKLNKEFVYDYVYISRSGDSSLFDFSSFERRDWEYVPFPSSDSSSKTVKTLKLKIEYDQMMMIESSQTPINWSYYNSKGNRVNETSWTGLIENEKNIWFHPPRAEGFKILEINPFPFVKKIRQGTSWENSLTVSSGWGDKRWKEWEGVITIESTYEIIEKTKLNTVLGNIDCWKIEGVGNSEVGETKLVSYFNDELGFVQLDYTNIDGSRLKMNLISVSESSHSEQID